MVECRFSTSIYYQCQSRDRIPSDVRVKDCTESICKIKKGSFIEAEVDFQTRK